MKPPLLATGKSTGPPAHQPIEQQPGSEPIEPPRREIDDTAYLQGLCSFYDDALRDADAVIEWAGWEDVAVCEAESAPN